MESVLDGLNDAQKLAVTSPAPVLQVLAPPGSGKTKTLTARVAYLIQHDGLDPSNIIVCTFTVKAAKEMRERIDGFLGRDLSSRLKLGTFHSIARRLLAIHGKKIGICDKFGIADTSDSKAIITRVIERLKLTIGPGIARSRISRLKADGVTAEKFSANAEANSKPAVDIQEIAHVYSEYEEQLKLSNILDYDDLLLRCEELLRRFPQCVSRIEAVLVDEFQDTNNVQYDLMNMFAQHRKSISIVGDPDQSIYGWRSAKIENLRKMQIEYPETHVVNLEENYRSSSCILLAAQELIEQDRSRHQKCLAPTHSAGEPPTLRQLDSASDEAAWIVAELCRVRGMTGGLLGWDDFAVLLRSAALSRLIEKELGNAGIPYRMVGGSRFYDRVEIKLVLDYLRILDNTNHSEALARVLNVPARGIGEKSVTKLLEEADKRKENLWTVILKLARGERMAPAHVSSQALRGLENIVNIVLQSQARLTSRWEESLADLVRWLLERLEIFAYLKHKYPLSDDHSTRWSNIQELIAQASENSEPEPFQDQESEHDSEPGPTESQVSPKAEELRGFLSNVSLSSDTKRDDTEKTLEGLVTLSTMHAAKGLEWPVVFIPAAFNGTIPHSRSEDADEERRLLYVAMTRAQCLLNISCPTKDSRHRNVELSSFLSPKEVRRRHVGRGPTITYDLVREMTKILKREDRVLDIERGRAGLAHHEDDQFTQNSNRRTSNGDESSADDLEIVQTSAKAPYKRCWNDDEGKQRHSKKQDRGNLSSTITATTTMERATSCTLACATQTTVTFVTAKTLPLTEKENRAPKTQHDGKTSEPLPSRRPITADGQKSISQFFSGKGCTAGFQVESAIAPLHASRPTARPVERAPPAQSNPRRPSSVVQVGRRQDPASATTAFRTPIAGAPEAVRRTLGVRRNMDHDWKARMSRQTG